MACSFENGTRFINPYSRTLRTAEMIGVKEIFHLAFSPGTSLPKNSIVPLTLRMYVKEVPVQRAPLASPHTCVTDNSTSSAKRR
jgi:hypothetical protein